MKFLDLNGLTHFWSKVKTWIGNNYLSLKGGTIDGTIKATMGFIAEDPDDETTPAVTIQYGTGIDISVKESGNTVIKTNITDQGIYAPMFKKTNGTSTEVLIADGSVKGIGSANGIAGLDANGYVPLAQLGNLDTTVAEVVSALPTTNIKKHIYLIKDASGVTQNQYEEYIYTGDTSATYDASKWEKLGDFRATVDLADYAKKSEAIHEVILGIKENTINLVINYVNGDQKELILPAVTVDHCGLMSPSDKTKLNLLDTLKVKTNVDVSQLLTASGAIPIGVTYDTDFLQVFFNTVAGKYISFTLPAAGDRAGIMTAADKTKLNGIATGATADSAIPISVIDALN